MFIFVILNTAQLVTIRDLYRRDDLFLLTNREILIFIINIRPFQILATRTQSIQGVNREVH